MDKDFRKRKLKMLEVARQNVADKGIESINLVLDNCTMEDFISCCTGGLKYGEMFSRAEILIKRKLVHDEVLLLLYLLEGFERNSKTACFILNNIAKSYADSEYRGNDVLYYYADLLGTQEKENRR